MSAPTKIEQAAALWVVRLERGLTPAEQDAFIDWLAADARHGDELTRQKAGWSGLDLMADWRPEHGREPNRDLLAPPSGWLRRHSQARWWVSVVGAAAVLAFAFLAFRAKPAPSGTGVPPPAPISLIETRRLPDGSTVELNRGAVIALRFTEAERRLVLERGEANFHVAKDGAHPFIVHVRGIDVQAVGTAFNVRLGESAVEVVVTEGTVQVQSPTATASRVEAGQKTSISLKPAGPTAVANVGPAEMRELLAWQPELLDFTEMPLATIVKEFNRRNAPVQLVIAEPALGDTRLNASLRSDNVEGFLRLIETGFGIKAQRAGEVILLRREAPR